MNRLTYDTRVHLSHYGESTRKMLTFDHMDRPEKGMGTTTKNKMQPETRPRPSPQMTLFGESTSDLLQFQEVVNSPIKETRRPKVRMHRSMESSTESRKPRRARSGAGSAPKDIFVPPMARVVHKSQSLPPVLPPKQWRKTGPESTLMLLLDSQLSSAERKSRWMLSRRILSIKPSAQIARLSFTASTQPTWFFVRSADRLAR
jgi:hypothetical protein